MSTNLRVLCLVVGFLVGISPALARDDTPSGDLPCSALCRYWLDLGRGQVAKAPPAPPSTLAPAPSLLEAKPAARSANPLTAKGRHEHARSQAQASAIVPLPVPRPYMPVALASPRPDRPLVLPSPEPSNTPTTTPEMRSESSLRVADPEPIRPQTLSPPPEPIVPLAWDRAAPSAASVSVPPVLLATATASVAIARPTPLLVKLSVWAALALLVGAFFAAGGQAARDGAETSPQSEDQHPSGGAETASMLGTGRQHRHVWDAAT